LRKKFRWSLNEKFNIQSIFPTSFSPSTTQSPICRNQYHLILELKNIRTLVTGITGKNDPFTQYVLMYHMSSERGLVTATQYRAIDRRHQTGNKDPMFLPGSTEATPISGAFLVFPTFRRNGHK
jgi:hypothetical protein